MNLYANVHCSHFDKRLELCWCPRELGLGCGMTEGYDVESASPLGVDNN